LRRRKYAEKEMECAFFAFKASNQELLMRGKLRYVTEFEYKPKIISIFTKKILKNT